MMSILLMAAMLAPGPVPERGITVPAAQIRETLRAFVLARLEGTHEEAELTIRSDVKDIVVHPGSVGIRVGGGDGRVYRGSAALNVEVLVDGKVERTIPVSFRVRTFGDVLVAKQRMERHAPLREGDVEPRRVETTDLRPGWFRSEGEVRSMWTKRIIAAGTILQQSMVEPLPIVFTGDIVTLTVRAAGVTLSVKATAREDGRLGDLITVQKIDAHDRIRCKVAGPGRVEMNAEQ